MDSNPGKTSTENINEVILRLLKLKTGTELDYQTYFEILKKKLTIHAVFAGNKLPQEEQDLLIDELNRIRKIKDKEQKRFKIKEKKVKVSSAASSKTGPRRPPPRSGGGSPPKTGSIVKAPPSGKITTEKLFNIPRVEPVNVRDITPDKSSQVDPLIRISDILDSILETLTNINNFDRAQANRQRTDAENKRRGQRESELESKPFEGIKKALSAITKPFQSIWDRIVNFITNVILGRIVIKLLEWFGDSKNQEKIQSIIRFLGDHWPTLLALYLRFGTGIGRFVGKLTRSLVKGSFKLVKLVAGLAAKLGLKRAGKLASFIGGPRGRAIATGVGIAADVAVTAGTAFGASKLFGGEKQEPVAPEPVQQFSGGGSVKIPKFAGGGFANFGNMFKGAGFGSMFGPMGMLAGAALGSGIPQEMFSGLVKGPGGPKDDKIAARLSDGEFVMSAGAVKKYGVGTLEAMNAAGGGDNKPKFANGVVAAAGGGMIGDVPYYSPGQVSDASMRKFADRFSKDLKIPADEIYNSFKTHGYPKFDRILGTKDFNILQGGGVDEEISGGKEILQKMRDAIKRPQSFTQSSRAAAGLDDLSKRFDLDARTAPRYAENLPKLNRPNPTLTPKLNKPKPTSTLKPKIPTLASELSPSYFLRGQSSLLPQPTSQASSFNRYRPGATIRATGTGMEFYPELQRFASAESVLPRGTKTSGISKLLNNPALRFAGKAARVLDAPVIGDMILPEGTSEYDQRSNAYNDPRLSPVQRRIMMESVGLRGGVMKGGLGLKDQSFKDAPKTQIMTDDKGRPFVGYKALRSGKLTYIRGPQSGAGSSNMWENFGRMINPGAYSDIDKLNTRKKYEEASRNSVSSLKSRGASQATISRTQTKLNRSVPPLPRPKPKPQIAGGGMGGRRGSGSRPSSGSKAPSFNAKHSSGTRVASSTLGLGLVV